VRTALHSARCLLIFLLLFSRVPGATQALREASWFNLRPEGSVRVIYFGPSLSAQSRYKSLSSAKKDGLPPDARGARFRGALHMFTVSCFPILPCDTIPLHIFLGAFGPCFGQ
jgi:hypothetical protein